MCRQSKTKSLLGFTVCTLYRSECSSNVSREQASPASMLLAYIYHITWVAHLPFPLRKQREKQTSWEKCNKKCVKCKIISQTIVWLFCECQEFYEWTLYGVQPINFQHLEALITAAFYLFFFFFFLVLHFKHLQRDSVNHRAQTFVNIITLSCGSSILPNSKIQCQYFWDNMYLTSFFFFWSGANLLFLCTRSCLLMMHNRTILAHKAGGNAYINHSPHHHSLLGSTKSIH